MLSATVTEQITDRRESPRVPMRFLVRPVGSDAPFEEAQGDISLGGFAWFTQEEADADQYEARFLLPLSDDLQVAVGELVRQSSDGHLYGKHLRFTEINVKTELAVARYLHHAAIQW